MELGKNSSRSRLRNLPGISRKRIQISNNELLNPQVPEGHQVTMNEAMEQVKDIMEVVATQAARKCNGR